MSGKDWRHYVERNQMSQLTDGGWGDVGAQWKEQQQVGNKPGNESGDEVRWGARVSYKVDITGAGNFAPPLKQLLSAKMPARAWQVQVAFSLTGARPTFANDCAMLFAIENGVGSSKVLHYVQIANADLVVWAFPDDPFPPTGSVSIDLPARDIIISARPIWISDGSQNGVRTMTAFAMVAPIMR